MKKLLLISLLCVPFLAYAMGFDWFKKDTPEPEQSVESAPIHEQLKMQEGSRCTEKLEYYENQIADHPGNHYYVFMQNKWINRCSLDE